MVSVMANIKEFDITPVQPYGACTAGGCSGVAMYKVTKPKISKCSGNPVTIRFLCYDCKNRLVRQFGEPKAPQGGGGC